MDPIDSTLYCPLNYRPCKWFNPDEVQCILSGHPCTNTREEYEKNYKDEIYPCRSPAQWNDANMFQGLSCKFDDDEGEFAYLGEQPVLSRQTSEGAERPGWIIPRFTIHAHGSVGPGTTTIPPNMSLTTWGTWGKLQWRYINDKIGNLLSKRERLTVEDIKKIYDDVPETYQCSRNTFPPTWKEEKYKLGPAGNRVVPYNKDCYKITLSSKGTGAGAENDQAVIEDTTLKGQGHVEIIWRDGEISPKREEIWESKELTEVLEWIYQYSNKKYGTYKSACKLDNKREVGRIRVTSLSCLRYNSQCIIGSCNSRISRRAKAEKTDVSFEQIGQALKKRETKVLYRDPIERDPVENMAHWRIDNLSRFPYTQITPYDTYFENLENWVNTETNKNNLKEVYEILTGQIYKSLFLDTLVDREKQANWDNIPNWNNIKKDLLTDLEDFRTLLDVTLKLVESNDLLVSCSICRNAASSQDFLDVVLDYSACQEYIIKTLIFAKILQLGGNVDDLIDIEKQCLKSWIYFLIVQPQRWNLEDKNSDGDWGEMSDDDDYLFQNDDDDVSVELIKIGDRLHYVRAKNDIDELLPTGAGKLVPPPPHTLQQMDSKNWTDILKFETEEKGGVDKLKALYESAIVFIKNMNLSLCDVILNGKFADLNVEWNEEKWTDVITDCFSWNSDFFEWSIQYVSEYMSLPEKSIIEIIQKLIIAGTKIPKNKDLAINLFLNLSEDKEDGYK